MYLSWRQLTMSLVESVLVLSFICFSLLSMLVSVNLTSVHFSSVGKCWNGKAEVCIVICLPDLVQSCAAVWALCWIVTHAWLRVLPEGTSANQCQHNHWGVSAATKVLVLHNAQLFAQLGLSQTHIIFSCCFLQIPLPWCIARHGVVISFSQARIVDHCIFPACNRRSCLTVDSPVSPQPLPRSTWYCSYICPTTV